MSKDTITVEEQLLGLRDLSRKFKCLHELQVLQLKNWPFAIDPKIDKSTSTVDLEGKKVVYRWTGPKLVKDKNYDYRLSELARCVKFLLGGEFTLQVSYNGIKTFPINRSDLSKRKLKSKLKSKKPR